MMLTGGLVAEIKGHRSEWYMLLGYLFLFSDSFCMVRWNLLCSVHMQVAYHD